MWADVGIGPYDIYRKCVVGVGLCADPWRFLGRNGTQAVPYDIHCRAGACSRRKN